MKCIRYAISSCFLFAAFLGWSLLGSTDVWAQNGYTFLRKSENNRTMQWKRVGPGGQSNFPIQVVLDDAGSPDIPKKSIEDILKKSVNAWNGIQCTLPKLLGYGGLVQNRKVPFADRTNVVKFIQKPADWLWPKNQFAVTITTALVRSGLITDADILLNDWNFKFGINGGSKQADLQATLTHELGHVLGLDHSSVPNSTMYFAANVGETGKRILKEDDKKGICDLYPIQPCKEGEEKTAEGLSCFNGRWEPICALYSQACHPCRRDADCYGSKNFCITGVDGGRCGYECSNTKPCEAGYSCRTVQNPQGQKIGQNCIPDQATCRGASKYPCCRTTDDCLPTYNCVNGSCIRDAICRKRGETCSTKQTCCPGNACVNDGTGTQCRAPCDPFAPVCPRGLLCALAEKGEGFCVPPNGGGKEGDVCDSSQKRCEFGLYCDPTQNRCRFLCRPKVQGSCPPSYICKAVTATGEGLCYKDGRPCKTAAECPTGQICQNGFCRACTADSECPTRHRCVRSVCVSMCASKDDCPAQHECTNGVCEAGIRCSKDSDCTGGYVCKAGTCSAPQSGSCKIDADCGKGRLCVKGNCELPSECTQKCTSTEKCLNRQCVPLTCSSDGQCGTGFICRNSECIVATNNCGGSGPCPAGKECIQGRCVGQIGTICLGDESCVPGLTCAQGIKFKRCSKICAGASDCPNGFFCVELSGIGSGCWKAEEATCNQGVCKLTKEGCACSSGGQPPILEGLLCLLFLLMWLAYKRKTVELECK